MCVFQVECALVHMSFWSLPHSRGVVSITCVVGTMPHSESLCIVHVAQVDLGSVGGWSGCITLICSVACLHATLCIFSELTFRHGINDCSWANGKDMEDMVCALESILSSSGTWTGSNTCIGAVKIGYSMPRMCVHVYTNTDTVCEVGSNEFIVSVSSIQLAMF